MSLLILAWGGLYPIGTLAIGALGEVITTSYALVAFGLVLAAYGTWCLTRPAT